MKYIKPKDVKSPRSYVKRIKPLYDGGCEGFSIAILENINGAYSHDIDPHSYDVDPLEEGMAFKEQSLFACKQAVVQLYKDITFSFSWTLHRE